MISLIRQYIEGKLIDPIVGDNLPSDPRARGEVGYCPYATQILQNYFCTAKECKYENQSRITLDYEEKDQGNALPLCLSKGLEKRVGEELKEFAK